MLVIALISLALGIESGLNQPIIGLDYSLNSGISIGAFAERSYDALRLNIALKGLYFQGRNLGYSSSIYGIAIGVIKNKWRFSPYINCGIDYILRELNKNRESGMGFSYAFGFLINFNYQMILIRPIFYYEGITDFRATGGHLGAKLGIGYEW